MEQVGQCAITREDFRHLPEKEWKWPAAKQRVCEASEWLEDQQRIEAIFVQFRHLLLKLGHAFRKRRQYGEQCPPGKPGDRHEPNDDAQRPMESEQRRGLISARRAEQPSARKLGCDEGKCKPMKPDG